MSVTPDLRLLQPSSVGFVYCLLVFWFLCGEVLGISFSFTEQLEAKAIFSPFVFVTVSFFFPEKNHLLFK